MQHIKQHKNVHQSLVQFNRQLANTVSNTQMVFNLMYAYV